METVGKSAGESTLVISSTATDTGTGSASAPALHCAQRNGELLVRELIDQYMAFYSGRDVSRTQRLGWWASKVGHISWWRFFCELFYESCGFAVTGGFIVRRLRTRKASVGAPCLPTSSKVPGGLDGGAYPPVGNIGRQRAVSAEQERLLAEASDDRSHIAADRFL